jgi:hypothetical protein
MECGGLTPLWGALVVPTPCQNNKKTAPVELQPEPFLIT